MFASVRTTFDSPARFAIGAGPEPVSRLIDATLGPAHGVGYEETNRSWQYILPELRGRTHGIAAMNRLFTDNALGDGALDH